MLCLRYDQGKLVSFKPPSMSWVCVPKLWKSPPIPGFGTVWWFGTYTAVA